MILPSAAALSWSPEELCQSLFKTHLTHGVAERELEKLKPADSGRHAAVAVLARTRERCVRTVLAHEKAVAGRKD
jgi:hypothetical protein